MSDASEANDGAAVRRREAGSFLRSRRERLTPDDVGLEASARRRTPGLRREEVAQLAGVGASWYTWLEQGRDVRPSDAVLSALCAAMRLDATERLQLFTLYGRRPLPAASRLPERVDGSLRRMLDGMRAQPAYVLGRRWDLVAWNAAADAVFGPYDRLAGDERNALHLLFSDAGHRRLLVDWEAVARASLAMFRTDYARNAGDPSFERLVTDLLRESPEFADWWPQREVARPQFGVKRIDHPRLGRMQFEYSSFTVGEEPGMRLVVFTPLGDGATASLARLLATR